MKLIWCSSPYHIITAINMKVNLYQDEQVSIILTDYSASSVCYKDILQTDNRFEQVIYVPSKDVLNKFNNGSLWYRLFYFIKAEQYLKGYGINYLQVDELIFPFRDQIIKAIGMCAAKKGIRVRFSYYEDGTGSYCGGITAPKPSRLELALGVPIRLFIPDNVYLYAPQLCKSDENIKLSKLPSLNKPNLYKLYMSKANFCCDKKAVFLDQFPGNVESICDLLAEWSDKIMIKKHPKRQDEIYETKGFSHIWTDTQPFELSLINDAELENRVFITICSTAAMTPKILFNKEPTVIFINKIYKLDDINVMDEVGQLIDRFCSIYENKQKVYVPGSIEELREILNKEL